MPNKNEKYYRILDLDVGASQDEVKKAFRELSHIWHPDNHMGKSSNVKNRATEKFKELSNAHQVLKNYLSEEDSSRKAEEKRRAEQDRRDREEEAQKRQEENERRKKEEESRRKAEQDRRDREEKERKYWEVKAKKKQEEEKSKQRKKEYVFVGCPKCKKKINANTTECLRKVCESCGHVFCYFFEDGELIVVGDSKEERRWKEQAYGKERANSLHKEAQKKTETIETADYKWGWGWAFMGLSE
jgi:DnaJ-class molecular chaperone